MKILVWSLSAVAAIGILIFLAFRFLGGEPNAGQTAPYYERVLTVGRGDLEITVSANGVVEPINRVEIKSKASGRIEVMTIEEGDRVGQGGLIAELDRNTARMELEQAGADLMLAEANVQQAQNNLRRGEELFGKGLISAEEMDRIRVEEVRMRSQFVRAESARELAQERMDETIVRSPISGIVLTKDVEVGQIISSGVTTVGGGTLIATIADMDYVHVKAQVDEVDIGMVQPGQKAFVIADAYPARRFTGDVVRVAPQGITEQNITTFRVTILVKNDGGLLKSGMSADVEIEIASRRGVVMVPNEALADARELSAGMHSGSSSGDEMRARRMSMQDGPDGSEDADALRDRLHNNERYVLIINGESIEPRRVVTGISNFDYTEIREGLEAGDEILVRTLSRARQAGLEWQQRMRGRSGFGGFGR
jgi:HlyD family secretion protein